MIPFGLLSPTTGGKLRPDTPHSLRDKGSGERWPVVDGIPYLRVARDDLVRETLDLVDHGSPGRALELLLADGDESGDGGRPDPAALHDLVRDQKYAPLRDVVERLAWGAAGDYFLHRWTDPTYLAGLALLDAHWNTPRSAFELGCGIGHYLREMHGRGVRVAGADLVFAKLWVARHWVVGQHCQLVCFDARSPHWPIEGAPADLVLCSDLLDDLEDKDEVVACLRRTAGDEGWLAFSDLRNGARPDHAAGISADEIEDLFPDALVYDDAELTRALVEARAPAPADPALLADVAAFSLVCGPGMRPAPRTCDHALAVPEEGTRLRLNPLYRRGEDGDYAIVWPSPRYEAAYGPRATYPTHSAGPSHLVCGPDNLERVRRREFVALPERW